MAAGPGYEGPIWRFIDTAVREAVEGGVSAFEACESWLSGAYLLETLPCVLMILARHGHDPGEAIVWPVNETNKDTIAAIVEAAVGALHGKQNLPGRWRRGLLGRLSADDDGRLFRLLEAARAWWDRQVG